MLAIMLAKKLAINIMLAMLAIFSVSVLVSKLTDDFQNLIVASSFAWIVVFLYSALPFYFKKPYIYHR